MTSGSRGRTVIKRFLVPTAAFTAVFCVLTTFATTAATADDAVPSASASPEATSDPTAPAGPSVTQAPEQPEGFTAPPVDEERMTTLAASDDPHQTPAGCPLGPDMARLDAPPPLLDAWFNTKDIAERGDWDPKDHRPWKFSQQFSQLLCYAAQGSTVKIGMYFLRATNGSNQTEINRPESDPEVVYAALEWLAKNRGVKVSVILDNTNTCAQAIENQSCSHIMTPSARAAVEKRFSTIPNSRIEYCVNGCFNQARYGIYPYAIEHEKFIAVSDTDFPGEGAGVHPLVISSSTNIARSQIRNYHQEASSIYDDKTAFAEFDTRFDGMLSCAVDTCAMLGDPASQTVGSGTPGNVSTNPLGLVQEKGRKIWVDPNLYRYTDGGRGTTITFSPQRDVPDSDVFIHQFDGVDCQVDKKIRLAMFKLTDAKAQDMAKTLKALKGRGCDIQMLMTSQGGQTVISSAVQKELDKAKIPYKCTDVAMHTKMILIGPMTGNLGRVLHGTQNMSVAGQLYSEEHVITYDARSATGSGRTAIQDVYGKYAAEWFELSRGASKKHCG